MEKKLSGQVQVAVRYRVFDLDREHFGGYLESVARHARAKGWSDQQSTPPMQMFFRVDPTLSVEVRADNAGGFLVTASTTCIWPSGHR